MAQIRAENELGIATFSHDEPARMRIFDEVLLLTHRRWASGGYRWRAPGSHPPQKKNKHAQDDFRKASHNRSLGIGLYPFRATHGIK
jgi:hypothetical protein